MFYDLPYRCTVQKVVQKSGELAIPKTAYIQPCSCLVNYGIWLRRQRLTLCPSDF